MKVRLKVMDNENLYVFFSAFDFLIYHSCVPLELEVIFSEYSPQATYLKTTMLSGRQHPFPLGVYNNKISISQTSLPVVKDFEEAQETKAHFLFKCLHSLSSGSEEVVGQA